MRKAIIITCLVLSGLMILDSMNVGPAFVLLIFAGVIPGTNIVLSAQTMMGLFALLTGFVLARIANYFFLMLFARMSTRLRA